LEVLKWNFQIASFALTGLLNLYKNLVAEIKSNTFHVIKIPFQAKF